jgi:FemAB-related protein (PEP-CTERM system-associated)
VSSTITQAENRSTQRARLTETPPVKCHVQTLTPQLEPGWETYVNRHADGTLFHTLAWRDAVGDVFRHEDVYLVALRKKRMVGVLPLFRVASRVAGRMLVSVPYGVGGGILADDADAAAALFEHAESISVERKCDAIDLRSECPVIPGLPVVDRYVGFRRTLPEDPNDVLAWLPRKARAAARNAREKFRLSVSVGDQHLKDVWRLYSLSMRRLGSLTYPYTFFDRLVHNMPNRHWVSLVKREGRNVAGLVTFLFRDTVLPYFIGTTNDARSCSAANFIYLTVMERGAASGYRVFDFGRSRRENTGSFNFKRFNGFEPRPLGYQMYTRPGCESPNFSPDSPRFRFVRRIWPVLPLWVTRTAGAYIAKHIPG